jgi:hypothetical protein
VSGPRDVRLTKAMLQNIDASQPAVEAIVRISVDVFYIGMCRDRSCGDEAHPAKYQVLAAESEERPCAETEVGAKEGRRSEFAGSARSA